MYCDRCFMSVVGDWYSWQEGSCALYVYVSRYMVVSASVSKGYVLSTAYVSG